MRAGWFDGDHIAFAAETQKYGFGFAHAVVGVSVKDDRLGLVQRDVKACAQRFVSPAAKSLKVSVHNKTAYQR